MSQNFNDIWWWMIWVWCLFGLGKKKVERGQHLMTFLELLVFLRNWELGRVRPIDRSLGLGVAVQTFTRRSSTAGRSCWRLLKLVEGWLCQDLIQHPCRNLLGCNGLFVPLCSVGFICSLETFWFEEVNLLRGLFFPFFKKHTEIFPTQTVVSQDVLGQVWADNLQFALWRISRDS